MSNALRHGLPHFIPHLKFHIYVSVVKQIEEPQPLPVQFLNRRRIPPVLIEFSVRIHSQLSECVREGLKQKEYQKHDLKYHRHLQLQIEFEEGCVHVRADYWDYILGYYEILHEL